MAGKKVTIEYYGDPLLARLIGAVDVPAARRNEAAQRIGKAICCAVGLKTLDAVLIGEDGEKIDQIVVNRQGAR